MKRFREWLGRQLAWLAVRVTYPDPIYMWQLRVLTMDDYEKQLAEMQRAEAAMQARADGWAHQPTSEMKLRNGSTIKFYGADEDYAGTGHKPPSGMN